MPQLFHSNISSMSLVATALPACAVGRSEALYGPKEISVGLIVVNYLGAKQGLKEIDTTAITVWACGFRDETLDAAFVGGVDEDRGKAPHLFVDGGLLCRRWNTHR